MNESDHTWVYGCEIKTSYSKDIIKQWDEYCMNGSQLYDINKTHTERVMQLREQGVQEALSKLGYLNPEEAKELIDSLHNLCYAYRHLGGLDVAFDSELVQAQKLLDKYK